MKVKEIIKLLQSDGWRKLRSDGSHVQYMHPTKPGRVTVAMHPGDVHPKPLARIEQQSGLKLKK